VGDVDDEDVDGDVVDDGGVERREHGFETPTYAAH
jgi:hypothetical protein